MKAQINIEDVVNDNGPGVKVSSGSKENGTTDTPESTAVALLQTLKIATELLYHPEIGNPFATSIAAFRTLAEQLKERDNPIEEDIT